MWISPYIEAYLRAKITVNDRTKYALWCSNKDAIETDGFFYVKCNNMLKIGWI